LTPEEWGEVKAVLAEALELPAGERSALLDLRCGGNPALRREIEALLSASDGPGFLDSEPQLSGPVMTPGEVLGPYRIEKKLAEGGMGEVYQAFDSRLDRRVAIKVLPARLSRETSALIRFEREAKALAALSHPNILAIFDVGRHGGTAFAVTELLTGSTLRQRLHRGRLPITTAIEIAAQAARGLAVAHAEGIVHRDLKPENLFVTAGGVLKILDFGIAFTSPRPGADLAPVRLTAEHAVIGTARYMSPEQARGESCDHRSDIFSLGVVLYEMLAGSPAFPGETPFAALAAVVESEPVPLATLCPAASPQLVRLVHRCLDKEPARRYQSASDLAFQLESLAESATAPVVPGAPARRRRGWLRAAAAAGLLLAAGSLVGILAQRHWGKTEPPRFKRLTFRRGHVLNARFAPDGQTIVYTATWDGAPYEIFSARTDSPESRPLGLPLTMLLSVSTRGEMLIDILRETGGIVAGFTLARMPLAGGAPRPILEGPNPSHAEWAPDGETFALLRAEKGEFRIEYPRGKVIRRSKAWTWDLRLSPTGDALGFCELGDLHQAVVMIDRTGKVLAQSGGWNVPLFREVQPRGCAAWTPDGKELWFASSLPGREAGLYALTRGGEVRPLLRVPGELALLDIGRDGRVLLTQINRRVAIMVQAPGETKERDLSWFGTSGLVDLSADGRWILFTESGQGDGAESSVYLRGTDGSPAVRLGDGVAQALSPDGRWVLMSSATDLKRLFLLPTGAGEPRELPPLAMDVAGAGWLPGGKQLLVCGILPGQAFRCYVMDIGGKQVRPVTPAGVLIYTLSPDGSKAATWSRPEGIRIYPLDGGEPLTVPAVPPVNPLAQRPIQWRADGRALYVGGRLDAKNPCFSIDEVALATGKHLRWKELCPADPASSRIWSVLMTPDGKAYAYETKSSLSTLYLVEGLK
jgi:serine/threonine protein kinase/Tol biopolymer transport system component